MKANSLLLLLLLLVGSGTSSAVEMPHIVVYLSDDHSQYDSSLYGDASIPTPSFEQLAADGMTFTHAFVASPSCAPSRAAMLTGLMPARNGAEGNHTYPPEGTHSLVSDLQALGYEVAAFGKVAHGPSAKQYGFDHIDRGTEYAQLNANVAKYLEERGSEKPLCLFAGISNPHVPWPESNAFDPSEVTLPPVHLDTPATRDHRAWYSAEIAQLDRLLGELRQMAAKHLGDNTLFVHTSDHGSQWAFGKWTLYDYGIRVPFIAAWPGVIEAGSRSDAMVSWIDLIPTLIELSGGEAPKGLDGRSFAAVLRGESEAHRDRIFTTQTGDKTMNVYPIRSVRTREWKLIHNLRPELAFTNHSDLLRKPGAGAFWGEWVELAKTDARAKRIVDRYYLRPEFELYRVGEDKWEESNLAEVPEHAALLSRLKAELAGWMKEQGDTTRLIEEPRPLNRPETWHPDYFVQPAATADVPSWTVTALSRRQ